MHWTIKMCNDFNISLNELARIGETTAGSLGMMKRREQRIENTDPRLLDRYVYALRFESRAELISHYRYYYKND